MNGQYRSSGLGYTPPIVKNLLIINVIFFLTTYSFGSAFNIDLTDYLGLHYFGSEKFRIYQVITYMFMHGSIAHIFFNMFALWMFGKILEQVWGGKKFLIYYLVCGIGAALTHYIIYYFSIHPLMVKINTFLSNPDIANLESLIAAHKFHVNEYSGEIWNSFIQFQKNVSVLSFNSSNHIAMQGAVKFISEYKEYYLDLPNVIGASGAVFGILLAFGMLFPNEKLFIIPFPFPIKAKWFVLAYGAIELYSGFANNPGDNVAHFAHLGGMIFGFILIKLWSKKNYNSL